MQDIVQIIVNFVMNQPEEVVNAFYSYLTAMVFLVALIIISKWQGVEIANKLVVGTIRGTIQIILMALILIEIFNLENILIIFLVLTFMSFFAAYTVQDNLDDIPNSFKVALPSILVSSLSVMGVAVLLGVVETTGEFIVPMGGMIIGNSMGLTSLVIERMWSTAQKQRGLLETALALGASPVQATENTIQESIRSSLLPNLNRYASLGVVSIPGLMSGMIIGGLNPLAAALYQVLIFILIFLSAIISGIIVSRLFLKEMFNERFQLTVPPAQA
ncbi:MAG: iron export ABC transporter permease subunit FetB [Candidatus Lokiarchaeota archaeon]|nr:iron export ABC transporter permease subunit FetB [Candidatus Lokiarchaeota archaeon]